MNKIEPVKIPDSLLRICKNKLDKISPNGDFEPIDLNSIKEYNTVCYEIQKWIRYKKFLITGKDPVGDMENFHIRKFKPKFNKIKRRPNGVAKKDKFSKTIKIFES